MPLAARDPTMYLRIQILFGDWLLIRADGCMCTSQRTVVKALKCGSQRLGPQPEVPIRINFIVDVAKRIGRGQEIIFYSAISLMYFPETLHPILGLDRTLNCKVNHGLWIAGTFNYVAQRGIAELSRPISIVHFCVHLCPIP